MPQQVLGKPCEEGASLQALLASRAHPRLAGVGQVPRGRTVSPLLQLLRGRSRLAAEKCQVEEDVGGESRASHQHPGDSP